METFELSKPLDYKNCLGKFNHELKIGKKLYLPKYANAEKTIENMTSANSKFEIFYDRKIVYNMLKSGEFPEDLKYIFLPEKVREARGVNTEEEIAQFFPKSAFDDLKEFCIFHHSPTFTDYDVIDFTRPVVINEDGIDFVAPSSSNYNIYDSDSSE